MPPLRVRGRPLSAAALAVVCGLYCVASRTDVLPEDRADALATHYSGGGQDINGISLLVRKKVGDHVSISYNDTATVLFSLQNSTAFKLQSIYIVRTKTFVLCKIISGSPEQ